MITLSGTGTDVLVTLYGSLSSYLCILYRSLMVLRSRHVVNGWERQGQALQLVVYFP